MFDGQSHNVNPATPFPALAMAGRDEPWVNVGVSGQSWTQLAATQAMRATPVAAWGSVVVVLTGGTSDLGSESDSAATAFADMLAVTSTWRALGVDQIVAATVPPAAFVTGDEETQRLALNDLIRGAADFDAVLDLAAAPQLDDNTDATYYQVDQTHFATAGAAVAADLLVLVLTELLAAQGEAP